ncbi:MAG: site-specific DNA-methyltransferase, partial [Candidatus Eisenbacteria bacterium]|nr:site-specific DNA-methyltransferase [Candidatus Eisenbacteria bacterium]
GENVLDLFGGSGSTLIAAETTKRRCFMMELDPAYCDVIVERWQTMTERDAVLEDGGQSFIDVRSERTGD